MLMLYTEHSIMRNYNIYMLRPNKLMCFLLQSGDKVWTGEIIIFHTFLFYNIPCNRPVTHRPT